MSRPSRNVDKLLLKAARELLSQTGCSGMNIRQVAELADVNLGMFHYHFKTKNEFLRVLLQEIYEEMFSKLEIEINPANPPAKNLARALATLGTFIRDNRALIFPLMRDLMNGETVVREFVRANFPRHIGLLTRIVEACQKDGALPKMPAMQILPFLMSGIGFPVIMATALERQIPEFGALVEQMIFTDDATQKRVKFALKGVSK